LEISRSSAYYQPVDIPQQDLAIMLCMDELHMKYPFMGSRRLALELADEGYHVNRKKV
jgi:putative transposase